MGCRSTAVLQLVQMNQKLITGKEQEKTIWSQVLLQVEIRKLQVKSVDSYLRFMLNLFLTLNDSSPIQHSV